MGSPGYMSPEQMRSTKNVDSRTDIWSLGVILYELVAGRVPFQADTFSALCVKIAVDPHPPLPPLPEKLPRGFDSVLNRALEKDAARRFQSAAEFAQALVPYAGAQGRVSAQRLSAAPAVMPSAAYRVMLGPNANTLDAASGQARGARSERPSRPRTLILAGAGLVAVVTVGIAVGTRRGGGHEGGETDGVVRSRAHPGDPALVVAPPTPADASPAPEAIAAPPRPAPAVAPPSGSAPGTVPSSAPPVSIPDAGVIAPDAPHPAKKSWNKPEQVDPFVRPE
jgi:serine/threonine-protein kinase